jgi:hypothetical protein
MYSNCFEVKDCRHVFHDWMANKKEREKENQYLREKRKIWFFSLHLIDRFGF